MNTPWHLIDAYLDDALTPDENHELRSWLSSDRQHIRKFVLAVHQHRVLRSQAQLLREETLPEIALRGPEDQSATASVVDGRATHTHGATPSAETTGVSHAAQIALSWWEGFRQLVFRHRLGWAAFAGAAMLFIGVVSFNRWDQGVLPEVVIDLAAQNAFVRPPETLGRRLARSFARYQFSPFQSMSSWLERHAPHDGPGSIVEVGPARLLPTNAFSDGLLAGGWFLAQAGAELHYTNEATLISLKANTKLRILSARAGKRFELLSGVAEIDAAPQPPNKPLVVITPMAKVRVLGTKLSLTASGRSTRVTVSQGEVRLEARMTRQRAAVTAGQRGIAGTKSPLTTQMLRPITNHFGTGSILREYWLDVRGMKVEDLLANASFPDRPNGSEQLGSIETESKGSGLDHYGARFRGYLHAPVSGNYTFWIAADDAGELWLSTDEKPENKRLICAATTWSLFFRNWWHSAEQESAPIYLEGGNRYYIEALHKEGGGGDFFSAAWETPGSGLEVISGADLSPFETPRSLRLSRSAGEQ